MLIATAIGIACLALGGCAWGHRAALATDAGARLVIAQEIAQANVAIEGAVGEIRSRLVYPDLEVASAVGCLASSAARIRELAVSEIGRAQIACVYHGASGELLESIVFGSDADKAAVVGLGGLALQAKARRDAPAAIVASATEFAAQSAAGVVRVIVQRWIPTWILWLLAIALVIAVAIGLYALYVRWVIVLKNRALDEYDDACERLLEGRPREEKAHLARGANLRREHAPRNERRKRVCTDRPTWPQIRIPISKHEETPLEGVSSARDMLPDLRTIRTDSAAAAVAVAPEAIPAPREP